MSFELSIVTTAHNEAGNLAEFTKQVCYICDQLGVSYEVIIMNDGSTDNSKDILHTLAQKYKQVKSISFKDKKGQTKRLGQGIQKSRGGKIIVMDCDLEHDPQDIPRFFSALKPNLQSVVGMRKEGRKWKLLRKCVTAYIQWLTGYPYKDLGTYGIYQAGRLKKIELKRQQHRFINSLFWKQNQCIQCIPIALNRRQYGKSKYNVLKVFNVALELFLMTMKECHVKNWRKLKPVGKGVTCERVYGR